LLTASLVWLGHGEGHIGIKPGRIYPRSPPDQPSDSPTTKDCGAGFEIETELSVHALQLELPVAEIETPYYARPDGSHSKLNTWRDGVRILGTIIKLYRSERPLGFFSGIGISLAIMSVGFAIPILVTYLHEGIVPRLPTAVLSTGLMIIAALAITCGLVLDTVTRGRREIKLLAYLAQRAPGEASGRRDRA
jgi:hypothetical protein